MNVDGYITLILMKFILSQRDGAGFLLCVIRHFAVHWKPSPDAFLRSCSKLVLLVCSLEVILLRLTSTIMDYTKLLLIYGVKTNVHSQLNSRPVKLSCVEVFKN